MLYEIMMYIRNFFPTNNKITGRIVIEDGIAGFPFVEGQYYLIEGSMFNDGVYKHPAVLKDETFNGTVTALALPPAFVSLVEEIEAYVKKHPAGEYTSESFGNYSYTKATDSNGNIKGWKSAFKSRLDAWRKL